ncbi:MAG TPA: S8 family serine peptidase [Allosphingosinicella sp.]|jgi:subtilisin family serine protease
MASPVDSLIKLHSRLRCVANGRTDVNALRAQRNGAVRVASAPRPNLPTMDEVARRLPGEPEAGDVPAAKEPPYQKRLSKDVEVNVFVLFNRDNVRTPKLVTRRNGRIGTATATLAQLRTLDGDPSVQLIELGETLRAPDPRIGTSIPGPPADSRHAVLNRGTVKIAGQEVSLDGIGEKILVGIVDVGGIDFAHPDFMDDQGNSRVVAIWDQGGDAFDPPRLTVTGGKTGPSTGYGSEIGKADIALALSEAQAARVSPHDLAPQSQRMAASHATHVASIAAGRSGVCKRAKIGAVLISMPEADLDRQASFYDTTRIVDAIEYLFMLADREGCEGVSINISLGTNGGAHDGSELISRWIDRSLAEPGRSVCVAAGNSGQEAAQFDGDVGFWSGRVHASGRIPAAALRRDLEWVVVGDGKVDLSENELEIWYGAEDEFSVELFTPRTAEGPGRRIGPVGPRQRIENVMLADGTFVSIYNVLSDAKNGDNRISLYLSPFLGQPVKGISAGSWKVRLTGKIIRNGAFNAWIERDDPGRTRIRSHWRLPSFFGPGTFVDNSTLSSLACGPRVIGVANLDEAREMVNVSSSQGPTRDGRLKPEIAAPGTDIVAACGFDPATQWIAMTGTSMASPYVTGVAALMLSLNPRLTAAQIGGIIRRTSNPLPGSSYEWQNGAGFGVIDPQACLREALRIAQPTEDLTPEFTL